MRCFHMTQNVAKLRDKAHCGVTAKKNTVPLWTCCLASSWFSHETFNELDLTSLCHTMEYIA